ncbi:aminotransferase class I/II-fold pyridoxal phosphate-dependent enzyme [Escherichia coli]
MILAGTNNYLGLTFNHDAISEGQAALAAQGTGTTGSRMANGSYAPHLALEKEIAEFFNRPTAIVFSTGYTANLGVISALADHNAGRCYWMPTATPVFMTPVLSVAR